MVEDDPEATESANPVKAPADLDQRARTQPGTAKDDFYGSFLQADAPFELRDEVHLMEFHPRGEVPMEIRPIPLGAYRAACMQVLRWNTFRDAWPLHFAKILHGPFALHSCQFCFYNPAAPRLIAFLGD
jgi:hypothetical protein